MREHVVQVRMSARELGRLDALAAERGMSRSAVLRSALEAPPAPIGAPTRAETLELLAEAARGGSVVAMATLARELRLAGDAPPGPHASGRVNLDDVPFGDLQVVR